jgi:hypothetical protein
MINPKYYHALLNKYSISNESKKTTVLTGNVILANYERKNLHFNFPKNDCHFEEVVNLIYEKLSIDIFQKYADFSPIVVGSKWIHKTKFEKNKFEIISCVKNNIVLKDKKKGLSITNIDEENLFKNFFPALNRNIKPIKDYRDFFKDYSEWFVIFGAIPTHFSKKVVFISSKSIWEKCHNHYTPAIYLPNKRENNRAVVKTIPALDDCIAYFTPKYEVCFEQLLDKGKKIDTVVLCDTDLDTIPQILQDQARFNFKLIVISNKSDNSNFNGILSWNWGKEEIELLDQQ